MTEQPLSVFLSYARESVQHTTWVTRLADTLEQRPELHIVFDEYDLHAGKDLTHFMERALQSERVIVVITPEYVRKAGERRGGVGYESSIISASLLTSQLSGRFIPVLRRGDELPPFLQSKLFVDFRDDGRFHAACAELVAALRGSPAAQRPVKLSTEPARTDRTDPPQRDADVRREPLVILTCDIDGTRNLLGAPIVENIGEAPATNVKIEDIRVTGARGLGTFDEIDVLRPRETRQATFDAPDEGLAFRGSLVHYLSHELEHRPPIDVSTALELFVPRTFPIYVRFKDPRTGQYFRSEHELQFTFDQRVTISFVACKKVP